MKPASFAHLILAAAAFAGTFRTESANAADLILDNGGLKNTYRLVFSEFAPREEFVSGSFEILSDETDQENPAHQDSLQHDQAGQRMTPRPAAGRRIELRVSPLVASRRPSRPAQPRHQRLDLWARFRLALARRNARIWTFVRHRRQPA
ncbi:MAG: hypothetical protein R3F11_29375 [Verrucomicrobiales bacterium]